MGRPGFSYTRPDANGPVTTVPDGPGRPVTAASASPRLWLFGPLPDLLFGCGLLYAAVFVFQAAAGAQLSAWFPLAWLPFLTLVLGTPHYGATLLRVYETRESRQRYTFFAVYVSVALFAAYLFALRMHGFGSLLITLYLTWSPWHYSGQNYGVAVLFLGRAGVQVTPRAKRLLYFSFLLSFVLTVLALHVAESGTAYAPAAYQGTVYRLVPLGIPPAVHGVLFPAVLVAYLAVTFGALGMLARRASLGSLAPAVLLVLTQALWFAVPTAARHFGLLQGVHPLAAANGAYTVMWVAAGHFVQYLWITTYYGVATSTSQGKLQYLGKALLAGAAIWTLPTLIFAPGVLGSLPFDLGLGLLTAAVVNLHHFILDGAIWKLRDGPVARVLLRSREAAAPETAAPGRRWVAPVVWATGVVCVVATTLAFWEEAGLRRAAERNDVERMRTALRRVEWIGRETPKAHVALAKYALRNRDARGARRHYQAALDLYPTSSAWAGIASLDEDQNDFDAAAVAWEAARALDPDDAMLHYRLGLARLRLDEPERARQALARAAELAPEQRIIQLKLEQAERRAAGSQDPGDG